MLKILRDNYSLSELEERLGTTLVDLEDGLEDYIESNYSEVQEMLREDLWDVERI